MTERLKVLGHHKDLIEEFYPNIYDIEEAKIQVEAITLKAALKFRKGNGIGYEHLKNGDQKIREHFVESVAQLIIAVNTGNYKVIPDISNTGKDFDIWCASCGNLLQLGDGLYECGA